MSDLSINQNEQAREAERAVLGGLMLETHRFDTVIQVKKKMILMEEIIRLFFSQCQS